MPCCGQKRKPDAVSGYATARWLGRGIVKVFGAGTGRTYQFNGHGSVLSIDKRDMASMTSTPNMVVFSK